MALATAATEKKKTLTQKIKAMRKGYRFLIGLASAGLTFGILFGTLGSNGFNKYGKHRYAHGMHHDHHCDEAAPN
jgi:hypothetical protein